MVSVVDAGLFGVVVDEAGKVGKGKDVFGIMWASPPCSVFPPYRATARKQRCGRAVCLTADLR